jgi:hypothetical protein
MGTTSSIPAGQPSAASVTTLLDLVTSVSKTAKNEHLAAKIVLDMVRAGDVVLEGQFRAEHLPTHLD